MPRDRSCPRRGCAPLLAAVLWLGCGPSVPGQETPETSSGSEPSTSEAAGTTVDPSPQTSTTTLSTTGLDDTGTDDGTTTGLDDCPEGRGWVWEEIFEDRRRTHGQTVVALPDSVMLLAWSRTDATSDVPMVRHYDRSGALQWELEGPSFTTAGDMTVLPDGELVVCGYSSQSEQELWLGRFDVQGDESWSRMLPGTRCTDLHSTRDPGFMLAGLDADFEPTIMRLDDSGNIQDSWVDGSLPLEPEPMDMATDGTDRLLLSGLAAPSGWWLGRLGAGDRLEWSISMGERDPNERADAMVVDPTGDIILAGWSSPR